MNVHAPHDVAAGDTIEAIIARVRVLAQRRILWLSALGAAPAEGPFGGLEGELRAAVLGGDRPEAEAAFHAGNAEARRLGAAAEALERALLGEADAPLAHLAAVFALRPAECDLLMLTVAAAADPSLSEVFAFIGQGPARRHPTDALAGRLFGHGRGAIHHGASPLARWRLVHPVTVEPGEPPALAVDPVVLAFLEGRGDLDAGLVDVATVVTPEVPLPRWPVAALVDALSGALEAGRAATVTVTGPRLSGRRTFAAAVAERAGAPLIAIDAPRVPEDRWPDVVLLADRQALIFQCALAWCDGPRPDVLWPRPARLPLEFMIAEPPADAPPAPDRWQRRVALPRLTVAERAAAWAHAVPASAAWPAQERAAIAERYALEIGEILRIALQDPAGPAATRTACREAGRGRLGEVAKLLDCPFAREDLHVGGDLGRIIDEFLFEARERTRFWEDERARALFPRGTGLTALMCGPPGTGKTMAAQVIAAELGLDLFRIDVAATVDKYIGETAKNLSRIFARAGDMDAVLFFDEADALFSKRTDVKDSHDRYANADTNYLLQLVEDYPGVALLATNKRQNMDDAFLRRLRYLMYFSRPGAAERDAIWRQLVGALAGPERVAALGKEIKVLAQLVDVSGAEIKNAALAAAFIARQVGEPVGVPHLLRGLKREFSNQGRDLAVSAADIAREAAR